MKNVVAAPSGYDWEGDRPPRQPYARTVIYEMHLAGFTRHPNSGVTPSKRGTYAGLAEKMILHSRQQLDSLRYNQVLSPEWSAPGWQLETLAGGA